MANSMLYAPHLDAATTAQLLVPTPSLIQDKGGRWRYQIKSSWATWDVPQSELTFDPDLELTIHPVTVSLNSALSSQFHLLPLLLGMLPPNLPKKEKNWGIEMYQHSQGFPAQFIGLFHRSKLPEEATAEMILTEILTNLRRILSHYHFTPNPNPPILWT